MAVIFISDDLINDIFSQIESEYVAKQIHIESINFRKEDAPENIVISTLHNIQQWIIEFKSSDETNRKKIRIKILENMDKVKAELGGNYNSFSKIITDNLMKLRKNLCNAAFAAFPNSFMKNDVEYLPDRISVKYEFQISNSLKSSIIEILEFCCDGKISAEVQYYNSSLHIV